MVVLGTRPKLWRIPAMAAVSATPSARASGAATVIDSGAVSNHSAMNNYRINAVAELLFEHVSKGQRNNPAEFFHLCLLFSRGIDHAVSNSEIPSTSVDLLALIKQICFHGCDLIFQGAIMVLIASVKNASRHGWFSNKDAVEIHSLSNEISRNFCKTDDVNTDTSGVLPIVSVIMSRFYPRMSLGQVFTSLNVKPGYGTYVVDFNIPKDVQCHLNEKICLFVAQVDDFETSSCLISPSQVSFLLNGRGIERRTVTSMDPGPQIPTIVTPLLKYGTNLLQAVGQFTGQCLILVAFMSVKSSTDTTVLQDYVTPTSTGLNIDSEVIEGPSRISLKCPISCTRIKIPVKGHLCKHLQCFDFSNFVAINSRRPSWRCPHCNQFVCCTDIRIDRDMLKILKEVDENVVEVIISLDRSWKSVCSENCHTEKHDIGTERNDPEILCHSSDMDGVLDLTVENNEINSTEKAEIVDRKPYLANIQTNPGVTNSAVPEPSGGTGHSLPSFCSGYWENMYLSTIGHLTPNTVVGVQLASANSQRPLTSNMPPPMPTDSVSFAVNREADISQAIFHGSSSSPHSQQGSLSDNLHPQQLHAIDPFFNNELGRILAVPRNVSRIPVAVQALPAQWSRPPSTTVSLHPPSTTSAALNMENGSNIGYCIGGQQQQHPMLNTVPATDVTVSPLQHTLPVQVRNQQDLFTSGLSSPHVVGLSGHYLDRVGSHGQAPNMTRVSPLLSRTHPPQEGGGHATPVVSVGSGNVRHTQFVPTSQHIQRHTVLPIAAASHIQASSRPNFPFRGTPDGVRIFPEQRVPHSTANVSADVSADVNWRPAVRMRGSLSGRAYSAALNQMMILPTQSGGVGGRIPVSTGPSSLNLAPQLQAYLNHSGNPLVPHEQVYPVVDSSGLQWSVPYPNSL